MTRIAKNNYADIKVVHAFQLNTWIILRWVDIEESNKSLARSSICRVGETGASCNKIT